MTTIILCTDGSDVALEALRDGVALFRPDTNAVITTVIESMDDSLVTGSSGFAGGAMSAGEYERLLEDTAAEGEQVVKATAEALGLANARTCVVRGGAGPAICDLATEVSADAVVMGSRGRGGIKRAMLGSVSDYVLRNAPCSVLITRHAGS